MLGFLFGKDDKKDNEHISEFDNQNVYSDQSGEGDTNFVDEFKENVSDDFDAVKDTVEEKVDEITSDSDEDNDHQVYPDKDNFDVEDETVGEVDADDYYDFPDFVDEEDGEEESGDNITGDDFVQHLLSMRDGQDSDTAAEETGVDEEDSTYVSVEHPVVDESDPVVDVENGDDTADSFDNFFGAIDTDEDEFIDDDDVVDDGERVEDYAETDPSEEEVYVEENVEPDSIKSDHDELAEILSEGDESSDEADIYNDDHVEDNVVENVEYDNDTVDEFDHIDSHDHLPVLDEESSADIVEEGVNPVEDHVEYTIYTPRPHVNPVVVLASENIDDVRSSINAYVGDSPAYLIDLTEDRSGYDTLPDNISRSFISITGDEEEFSAVDVAHLVSQRSEGGDRPFIIITGADEITDKVESMLPENPVAMGIINERVREVVSQAKDNGVTILIAARRITPMMVNIIKDVESI